MAYKKKLPRPRTVYVVDFFCGAGGMSYGFSNTRQSHLAFDVLAGIDIDSGALATYERNVGAPGVKADISEIGADPSILRTLLPRFDPDVHRPLVFIGCAPCQGFSALRKGDERDDARNNLMVSFAQIVAFYKPDAIVMENVPEILKGKFAHYFDNAALKLRDAGYTLKQGIVDLSAYGVPQRRKRAIVTGARKGHVPLPTPIFAPEDAPTVRDAISHLRPLESGEVDPFDPLHRVPKHTQRLVDLIKQIPPDGGDRRSLPLELRLKSHVRLDDSQTPGFTDVYGRLRWDTPSVTITAKSRSASSGRFLHPEQNRNISVREAAILQGFPQVFSFAGTPTQQYRHIGEAVPPLFARFVAWQLLEYFAKGDWQVKALFEQWRSRRKRRSKGAKIKVIDAFCGAGGMGLGFEAAGMETAFAFDMNADAVATYRQNVADVAEVFDVNDKQLVTRIASAVGDGPFCIAGGPPCQGFSHQRRGEADDPRNQLVLRFASLVERLDRKPHAVVLENVTDLDLPRGKLILAEYVKRLRAMGYKEFRYDLNSADFGVPQLRNRIIVVALTQTVAKHFTSPVPLTPGRWPTVGEALAGLPDPAQDDSTEYSNHEVTKEGALNRRRIAYVDMGHGRLSIPPDLQLPCHAGDYRGHRDVYGRLDWFSQARTVTGGHDSFTRGEYGHPFRHRSITSREAAQLQGFPSWFAFVGNRASVRRQIGNAVPPPMAYAVARAIAKAIGRAVNAAQIEEGDAAWAV
ncbi:DNA cytosine methyltransferase [Paraburkholderia nodosa]|uniref:DNA cytosine methyltransferase n=1 Tax=Paraburkholderia nodosa TaxID=392320 RepID=UPI0004B51A89|nr:DNA cytosine methyltransferase [Paraburkholderia nodosa]